MQALDIEYCRDDEKGKLIQVNTDRWEQFNYLKINKGQTFGGHYHKHKTELFYLVRGAIIVRIIDKNSVMDFMLEPGQGFIIEPYDSHTLCALENSEIVELLSSPYSKEDVYNE